AVITSATPTSGALTIAGAGRVALTASNTFTGGVTINATNVILTARNANALGNGAGNVTVGAGATLEFDGVTGTLGSGRTITLSGTGATELLAGGMTSRNIGALRVSNLGGGTLNWQGPVTLAAAATIHIDKSGDTLQLSNATNALNLSTFALTVEG